MRNFHQTVPNCFIVLLRSILYTCFTIKSETTSGFISTPFESLHNIYNNSPVSIKQMLIYSVVNDFKVKICLHLRPHRGARQLLVTGYSMCFRTQLSFRLIARCMTAAGHVSSFTSTINSQACTNQKQGSPSSSLF